MEVDGFFAALICSPEIAKPNEYLAEIWGEMTDDEAFASQQEFQEFLSLTDAPLEQHRPQTRGGRCLYSFVIRG
jgi:yecA family protein